MKTKDFIKMLQKEDPSGESHIRMSGGIPIGCEGKAGYWDGPYEYIDEDGNYVYTTQGGKVDIYTLDIFDFVGRQIDRRNTPSWDEVKAKFKFDLTYSIPEHREERTNLILKEAEEAYHDIIQIKKQNYERTLAEMEENAIKGWKWFQNKLVDTEGGYHHYYTWKIIDETGRELGSNVYYTESIQLSGKWNKQDSDTKPGYYEWVYDFDGVFNKINDFITKTSQHLFTIEGGNGYYKFIPFMKNGKLIIVRIHINGDKISAEMYENCVTKKDSVGAFKHTVFYPYHTYKAIKKRRDFQPIFDKIIILAKNTEYKHNIWSGWCEVIKDWKFEDF